MSEQRRPIIVIAEAGVNHNGDLGLARELISAAADAGADFVKFQTFVSTASIRSDAPKAKYQETAISGDEGMLEMVKKLELSTEAFQELAVFARGQKIGFLSTAFDLESLKVVKGLDPKFLKIPSGEITNAALLLAASNSGLPLLISTGMANKDDIQMALGVVAFGIMGRDINHASTEEFARALSDPQSRKRLKEMVTLLHCTTEYPAPIDEINLSAMTAMGDEFGLSVGYSDHSLGISVPIAAAALGATVLEKHITIDRNLKGPDHAASLEPDQMNAMVAAIRDVELALGSSEKGPTPSELKNRDLVRKSLVALRAIDPGEILTSENVGLKRPAHGLPGMKYFDVLGSPAKRHYQPDEYIELSTE